jgi:hypothetical protein
MFDTGISTITETEAGLKFHKCEEGCLRPHRKDHVVATSNTFPRKKKLRFVYSPRYGDETHKKNLGNENYLSVPQFWIEVHLIKKCLSHGL